MESSSGGSVWDAMKTVIETDKYSETITIDYLVLIVIGAISLVAMFWLTFKYFDYYEFQTTIAGVLRWALMLLEFSLFIGYLISFGISSMELKTGVLKVIFLVSILVAHWMGGLYLRVSSGDEI
jgi:hypothetical protein